MSKWNELRIRKDVGRVAILRSVQYSYIRFAVKTTTTSPRKNTLPSARVDHW